MNATNIYKDTTEAIRIFTGLHEIKGGFLEELKQDPDGCTRSALPEIRALGILLCLQRDALHEMQRKEGRGSQLAGAKSLLKTALKQGGREMLHGYWLDNSGRQCLCTGYHAARLLQPLEGLPKIPEDVTPFNLDPIFDGCQANKPLNLPSVADVKLHIVKAKADHPDLYTGKHAWPIEYDFGPDLPLVNALYLLDLLQLLPDCTAKYDGLLNPLYFSSQAGDGVLLPVRRKV